jgi:sugar transferase EpsL
LQKTGSDRGFFYSGIFRWSVTIFYACGVTALSLMPSNTASKLSLPIPHFDKIAHAGMYAILAVLVCWAMRYRFHHRLWLVWVVLGAAAYGAIMEVGQFYLIASERSFSYGDMLANTVGASLAVIALGFVVAWRRHGLSELLKREFDVIATLAGLTAIAPFLLVLAVLVRVKHGKPIFFRQQRPGRDGKPFMLLKFRTMTNERDDNGELLADDRRLTRFGKFLRSTSLDELPELFNVLKGDMSLVGPRPLLMQYLSLYNSQQARRHEVQPGITGWAQVNGRNAIGWDEKFNLDVWYVDNRGFWLDLKILWLTVWHVIARRDINAEDHATMPAFTGNHSQTTTKK